MPRAKGPVPAHRGHSRAKGPKILKGGAPQRRGSSGLVASSSGRGFEEVPPAPTVRGPGVPLWASRIGAARPFGSESLSTLRLDSYSICGFFPARVLLTRGNRLRLCQNLVFWSYSSHPRYRIPLGTSRGAKQWVRWLMPHDLNRSKGLGH